MRSLIGLEGRQSVAIVVFTPLSLKKNKRFAVM